MVSQYFAPDIECDGCANAIRRSLGAVPDVAAVNVDIAAKVVTVQHGERSGSREILAALDRAGFTATETENAVAPATPASAG